MSEFFQNALARLKSLPWWAWLVIGLGLFLGYELFINGAGNTSQGVTDQSGDSTVPDPSSTLGDQLDPNLLGNLGDVNLGNLGNPGNDGVTNNLLGERDIAYNPHDPYTVGSTSNSRVVTQGYDIHQANQERQAASNAAQAKRSRQQAADIRQYQKEQKAAQAAKPPTGRRQDVAVGSGPDGAVYHTKAGDSISEIAARYGINSEDLYDANQDVIESGAREHGLSSSYSGWFVPGGVTLKIPRN